MHFHFSRIKQRGVTVRPVQRTHRRSEASPQRAVIGQRSVVTSRTSESVANTKVQANLHCVHCHTCAGLYTDEYNSS